MIENIYSANKIGFRDSMSKNSIGSGLGTAITFDHADSIFIGVVPGKVSRVTVVVPFGLSGKKTIQIQKSLHIIEG